MKDKAFLITGAVSIACILVMVGALIYSGTRAPRQGEFVPPPFDTSAQVGMPQVPQGLGWSEISQEGMGFSAHLCGRPVVQAGSMTVFFVNPAENLVWLKLRILDQSGKTLGESGLLRPGEYIESVPLQTTPVSGAAIQLKIMAYEPETYYSAGAVGLNTTATVK